MSTHDHGPEPYSSTPDSRHAFPLILTVVLLVFFLIGFFSLYFCRYLANAAWLQANPPNPTVQALPAGSGGLHASIVASFPTLAYAQVKDHRPGKPALECAVCLSEFSDDDVLRLITACSHAFHPGCIDLWFESHTTCPVCRQELDPAEKLPEKTPELRVPVQESDELEETAEDAEEARSETRQRISFKEEEEEGQQQVDDPRRRDADVASAPTENVSVAVDWLPRSHSTGHSLADNSDRFALRLPENLQERIRRERNWTGSCIAFGDLSNDLLDCRKEDHQHAVVIDCSEFSASRPLMT